MKNKGIWAICLLFSLVLGCQSADEVVSTDPESTVESTAVAIDVTATEAPTTEPTATTEPTNTPESTPTPEPTETPTPEPTSTSEPVTPLPTVNVDARLSVPDTANPYDCLQLSQIPNSPAPYRVIGSPDSWTRPSEGWQEEVFTGYAANYNLIHLGLDVEGDTGQLDTILNVLDKHDVKTTMFLVGEWSEKNPEWIVEFDTRGHEFANHTDTHGDMAKMTAEQVTAELNRTEEVIQSLTGKTTKPWLRPPFGSRSEVSLTAAAEAGWTNVIWSGSSLDWEKGSNEETMCSTMMEGTFPGSILYTHSSHPELANALDRYIGEMQARGYTFVPLSVILSPTPEKFLELR